MAFIKHFWKTLVFLIIVVGLVFVFSCVKCGQVHSGPHYHHGGTMFFFWYHPFGYYGHGYYGHAAKTGAGPRGGGARGAAGK